MTSLRPDCQQGQPLLYRASPGVERGAGQIALSSNTQDIRREVASDAFLHSVPFAIPLLVDLVYFLVFDLTLKQQNIAAVKGKSHMLKKKVH